MGNGKGGAFQFRMSTKKNGDPCMMVEACVQSGPKPAPGSTESPFNWKDDKVVMMFNHNECGEIAAYVIGLQRKPEIVEGGIKLLHDQEREDGDNKSILTLRKPKADCKFGNWGVTIKRGERYVQMYLTAGEVLQIKTLCEAIIDRFASEEITINVPESRSSGSPDQSGRPRSF
jgi:hypothetical protein